jgi:hypothetical protein
VGKGDTVKFKVFEIAAYAIMILTLVIGFVSIAVEMAGK